MEKTNDAQDYLLNHQGQSRVESMVDFASQPAMKDQDNINRPADEAPIATPVRYDNGSVWDAEHISILRLTGRMGDEVGERIITCINEHESMKTELSSLRAANEALLKQLPEGMEHCTILFKECSLGHGWLTATNWVQHGCPTCKVKALSAALGDARSALQTYRHECDNCGHPAILHKHDGGIGGCDSVECYDPHCQRLVNKADDAIARIDALTTGGKG